MHAEPCNLREWRVDRGRLFTCGRPGRGHYPSSPKKWPLQVAEPIVSQWVTGLPRYTPLHIVSLLGRKIDSTSEFEHYPFRSSYETGTKLTLQEWISQHHGTRFVVHEFPTVDTESIPAECLAAATRCLRQLLQCGGVVVIVDSAGCSRAGRVCRELGLSESWLVGAGSCA